MEIQKTILKLLGFLESAEEQIVYKFAEYINQYLDEFGIQDFINDSEFAECLAIRFLEDDEASKEKTNLNTEGIKALIPEIEDLVTHKNKGLPVNDAPWIFCDEELPKKSGHYLTVYHQWDNGESGFIPYDEIRIKISRFQIPEGSNGYWVLPKHIPEHVENSIHKEIIKWMPLPEI